MIVARKKHWEEKRERGEPTVAIRTLFHTPVYGLVFHGHQTNVSAGSDYSPSGSGNIFLIMVSWRSLVEIDFFH